jgi:hypothetical protein
VCVCVLGALLLARVFRPLCQTLASTLPPETHLNSVPPILLYVCCARVCRYLILDEADRMLDMGFEPQIRRIVEEEGACRFHLSPIAVRVWACVFVCVGPTVGLCCLPLLLERARPEHAGSLGRCASCCVVSVCLCGCCLGLGCVCVW